MLALGTWPLKDGVCHSTFFDFKGRGIFGGRLWEEAFGGRFWGTLWEAFWGIYGLWEDLLGSRAEL